MTVLKASVSTKLVNKEKEERMFNEGSEREEGYSSSFSLLVLVLNEEWWILFVLEYKVVNEFKIDTDRLKRRMRGSLIIVGCCHNDYKKSWILWIILEWWWHNSHLKYSVGTIDSHINPLSYS